MSLNQQPTVQNRETRQPSKRLRKKELVFDKVELQSFGAETGQRDHTGTESTTTSNHVLRRGSCFLA
jgi:hypothetical protein